MSKNMLFSSNSSSSSQSFEDLGIYMDRYNLFNDWYYSTIYFTKPLHTVESMDYLTIDIIGRAPSGSSAFFRYHLNLLDNLIPGTPAFRTAFEDIFGTSYGTSGIVEIGSFQMAEILGSTSGSYVRFKLANNDKASPLIYTADIGWHLYPEGIFDRLYRLGSGARTEGTQMIFTSNTNEDNPVGSNNKMFHFERISTMEIQPTYLFSSHCVAQDYLYIEMFNDNPSNISYDYEFAAVTDTGELRTVLVSGQDLTTAASSVTTMLGALSTLGISVADFSFSGYIEIGYIGGTSGLFDQGIRLFGLRKMNA